MMVGTGVGVINDGSAEIHTQNYNVSKQARIGNGDSIGFGRVGSTNVGPGGIRSHSDKMNTSVTWIENETESNAKAVGSGSELNTVTDSSVKWCWWCFYY